MGTSKEQKQGISSDLGLGMNTGIDVGSGRDLKSDSGWGIHMTTCEFWGCSMDLDSDINMYFDSGVDIL